MRLVTLDVIRFFSAMAVVVYHFSFHDISDHEQLPFLNEITKFGYLGVPLFFMISGFVITLSAQNRSAYEFAVCRFARLYPTFWIGIAFTVLVVSIFQSNPYSLPQILSNLTMLNNYLGYENIDSIYWTLHAELKFYACIFLLLLFGVFQHIKIWLSLWLGMTVLYLLTEQPFFMGWFITPIYSSFFIAGIAFFLIHQKGLNAFTASVLLISFIVSSVQSVRQVDQFIVAYDLGTQVTALLLTWLFFGLFFLLVNDRINLEKRRIYLFIGGLTYPLYLIHNTAGKAFIDFLPVSQGIATVISIILLLIISAVIDVTIDKGLAQRMKHAFLQASFKPVLTPVTIRIPAKDDTRTKP